MTSVRSLYRMDAVTIYDPSKTYKGQQVVEEINSTMNVGIEVEVENYVAKKRPSDIWTSTADGSLRNSGVEWVSRPHEARYSPFALNELLGSCMDETSCCFSPRTSIHVHVNMQEVDETAVQAIVLLYSVFEKLFFKFTGRGRIKNIYCVPLIDTDCLTHFMTRNLHSGRALWSKYAALNLLPISEYGTIEFRHMHGTFDAKKVSIWIRMITKLCEYVIANQDEVVSMLGKMSQHYDFRKLLDTIFGSDAPYLKYQDFSDVKQGVGRLLTAFTSNKTSRSLLEMRDTKSAFYLGVM